jgi:trehalose synthase
VAILPGTRPAHLPRIDEVALARRPLARLRDVVGDEAMRTLETTAEDAAAVHMGRTIWVVNSTDRGGGVAEMTRTLMPYWRGAGLDVRWLVLRAPPEYFRLTKRLHNLLHEQPVRRLGLADRRLFEQVASAACADMTGWVGEGDIVLLEDPQTAGLARLSEKVGAGVIWRCHVGADRMGPSAMSAWTFLAGYLESAAAYVFTRPTFVPPHLDSQRVHIVAPAMDPSSAKNQMLDPRTARAILSQCGLIDAPRPPLPVKVRVDGRTVGVRRRAQVLGEGRPPSLKRHRLIVALARWDRLKDPVGILQGFAEHVRDPGARLLLVGPATDAVADDPEGAQVRREACAAWHRLPSRQRHRIQLATLPMADLDENALMVNALQRRAAVVVKKSLQEGFGLGVTEAMWKARPVIASAVGGHRDQISNGQTGVLLDDPSDLRAFGTAIDNLLSDGAAAVNMGLAARDAVRTRYLADRHFLSWMDVLGAARR